MKTGKSINQLAQSLVTLKESSKDFIVPTELLSASVDYDSNQLNLSFNKNNYAPNAWAHGQLSQYTKIPKAYYDRLNMENTTLLASNINHSFNKSEDESR